MFQICTLAMTFALRRLLELFDSYDMKQGNELSSFHEAFVFFGGDCNFEPCRKNPHKVPVLNIVGFAIGKMKAKRHEWVAFQQMGNVFVTHGALPLLLLAANYTLLGK